jgi:hypothetical protein
MESEQGAKAACLFCRRSTKPVPLNLSRTGFFIRRDGMNAAHPSGVSLKNKRGINNEQE